MIKPYRSEWDVKVQETQSCNCTSAIWDKKLLQGRAVVWDKKLLKSRAVVWDKKRLKSRAVVWDR
jgi:hypothetical protein